MPGFELIGKEEKESVMNIFDNAGGILFAHGFEALRNGSFQVRTFEKEFAEKIGAKHAQAVTSGTAGLKVVLKAAGVGPGDEVITQAFNFIATVEAILDVGAKPVIVNVDQSLNMCPVDLESKINSKTKAVIAVHMLGFAADIEKISKIATNNNLFMIEDNCESLGATWDGKALGTLSDAAVFSFDMGKTITCGEGGMIVTNNPKIYKYVNEYTDHGHENNPALPRGRDTRTIYGFNYRMNEMQAAVGRAQLRKLDFIVEENRARFKTLKEQLKNVEDRHLFANCNPLCDTYMFRVSNKEKRDEILHYLKTEGGGTKNVPDAIEWHCAAFWDHALAADEVNHAQKTKQVLDEYIAIPIALKRTLEDYKKLGIKINSLLNA